MSLLLGSNDAINAIRELSEQVLYDPQHFNEQAQKLQNLLNSIGLNIRPDGLDKDKTSEAY